MSQKLFEALANFNLDLALIQQIIQNGMMNTYNMGSSI